MALETASGRSSASSSRSNLSSLGGQATPGTLAAATALPRPLRAQPIPRSPKLMSSFWQKRQTQWDASSDEEPDLPITSPRTASLHGYHKDSEASTSNGLNSASTTPTKPPTLRSKSFSATFTNSIPVRSSSYSNNLRDASSISTPPATVDATFPIPLRSPLIIDSPELGPKTPLAPRSDRYPRFQGQ